MPRKIVEDAKTSFVSTEVLGAELSRFTVGVSEELATFKNACEKDLGFMREEYKLVLEEYAKNLSGMEAKPRQQVEEQEMMKENITNSLGNLMERINGMDASKGKQKESINEMRLEIRGVAKALCESDIAITSRLDVQAKE